jgi:orotidine-5'-phosphate decarboxylase
MAVERYAQRLAARIASVNSRLCVGLDPRIERHGGEPEEVERFLRSVIEETAPHAAAFKPNSAYFEAMGSAGVAILERIRAEIPADVPVILDVKRSDIGATQRRYAEACFEVLDADAATLNPFMGYDSIEPFLDYPGKGIYLLAVTSNPGSADLQRRDVEGKKGFERVGDFATRAAEEGAATDVGLVVGLTNAAEEVLAGLPDVPLLVPGLGAQGGDLQALAGGGRCAPIVVNVSRGVLYPDGRSPAESAADYREQIAAATD